MKGDKYMFCITGIYCKTLEAYINSLYASRRYDFRRTSESLSISTYEYHKILIRVYDSKDNSMEWLELRDFLGIVEANNLEVEGLVAVEFYADYKKRGTASVLNPDSVKFISIVNKYEGVDNTGINAYTKQKMLGADFDRWGGLDRIPRGFVKNGVLYLPDNVLSLGFQPDCSELRGMEINKVSISGDFDINKGCRDLYYVMKSCGKNTKLHVRGDLRVGLKLFRALCCDIEVDGELTCINLSKTYLAGVLLTAFSAGKVKDIFYLSDPRKVYRFDIKDNTFKRKNL